MYDEIIARHKPRGWKIVHTRAKTKVLADTKSFWTDARRKHNRGGERDSAAAEPSTKIIYCPKVDCSAGLFVLLHEFAHVHLRHWDQGKSSLHREEYEAEKYASHLMHAEGIPIPRWVIKWGRSYIRACIVRDEAVGQKIHAPARRFSR